MPSKIKDDLCITVDAFPKIGGARSVIHTYWKVLSEKYNVHFLTNPPKGYKNEPYLVHRMFRFPRLVDPFVLPFTLPYIILGVLRLAELHRKYRFKAVLPQDGIFTALYSSIFGKIFNVKTIIMDYGATVNFFDDVYWNNPFRRSGPIYKLSPTLFRVHTFLVRKLGILSIILGSKLSNIIMLISPEQEEIYLTKLKVPTPKIRYYLNCIEEELFRPLNTEGKKDLRAHLGLPSDVTIILFAARLAAEKGIEFMLPAVKKVLDDERHLIVLIAGSGSMKSYVEKWIKSNNIKNKVRLLGEIPHDKIHRYYQASDIFLYTATAGGTLSASVLEAMSCGCVVVATNRPRTHERVLNGTNGFLIKAGDTNAIYERLRDILNKRDDMGRIRKEARKWVIEHNSISALRNYLSII